MFTFSNDIYSYHGQLYLHVVNLDKTNDMVTCTQTGSVFAVYSMLIEDGNCHGWESSCPTLSFMKLIETWPLPIGTVSAGYSVNCDYVCYGAWGLRCMGQEV
jgi:hypothetical protein